MTRKRLVVSLHDVHPGSREAVEAQREALSGWGVARRSLLVVPEFHHGPSAAEPSCAAWLRQCQEAGDETVLHGYHHDRQGRIETLGTFFWSRLYTNREAEFLDLPPEKARTLLERGRKMLEGGGLRISGFIAPAWLMFPEMNGLLGALGFSYTNTLRRFVFLKEGREIASHSLCWSTRAAWRRTASLGWNRWLYPQTRGNALLRISLHPDDLLHVTIRQQIERTVKSALEAGFEPVTYADYAADLAG